MYGSFSSCRQFRRGRRERAVEVGGGLPLTVDQAGVHLVNQDVAAPAVLNGRAGVPFPLRRVFEGLQ